MIDRLRDRAARTGARKGKGLQFERINGFSFRHYAGEVVYNASGFLKKNTDKAHNDTIVFLRKCGNAVAQALLPTDEETTPSDSRRRGAGRAKAKVNQNLTVTVTDDAG